MKKIIFVAVIIFAGMILMANSTRATQCELPHEFPPRSGIIVQHPDTANSLVPCGQYPDCRCELTDFFVMLLRIFNFISLTIATPLAGLVILIGGILILISGMNASWYDQGRKMILGAVIAVVLIFTSWIIINVIMAALGFQGVWHTPFG